MKRLLRPTLSITLFLLALWVVATLLGRIDPFGEVPIVREKWEYWRENKDQFDTVFIGTSRTFRGVMPAVFDQLTAEAGMPTKSYNFGVDGMFAPEDAYVAEHLLRDPPKNLRWVFMEMGVFLSNFDGRPPDNIRTIYWHDWVRTSLCIREVLWPKKRKAKMRKWFKGDDDDPPAALTAFTHFGVYLMYKSNIGRGAGAWERLVFRRPINPAMVGVTGDGFLPTSGDGVMRGAALTRYEEEYAERLQTPARLVPLRPYSQESLDRVMRFVRACGARGVFIVAPTTGEMSSHPSPETGIPTLDFRDMKQYPELFAKEHRVDTAHMNAKGAEIYTRRLAERFVEAARPQTPQR